jgi:hypothetical protein
VTLLAAARMSKAANERGWSRAGPDGSFSVDDAAGQDLLLQGGCRAREARGQFFALRGPESDGVRHRRGDAEAIPLGVVEAAAGKDPGFGHAGHRLAVARDGTRRSAGRSPDMSVTIMPKHRHTEFLAFLKTLEKEGPDGLTVHLILDNYATHKHANVKAWLEKHPRFHLHFTPTSSSWLNLVERWFRELTDKPCAAAHSIPCRI